ncbi:MAG: hypothetical protein QNJ00_08540 [Woeseiaceae bacterium]|nr:hypothetical protein [Woeseiaceae bacterium]
MKQRIHAIAGVIGFATIAVFWLSTAISELFGSPADVATVKTAILWGLIVLIPALAITGGSGMALGRGRSGPLIQLKQKRMPFIALNGLLILVPSAVFLANRASAGVFDAWFYGIQGLELLAGIINLSLMGMNIRDGLKMSGRLRKWQQSRAEI